jgi:hypothetical protein
MRLPRVRLTVMQAIVAVALVAFTIAGIRGWLWRAYCLDMAACCAAAAQAVSRDADSRQREAEYAEAKARRGEPFDLPWSGTYTWKDAVVVYRRSAESARRTAKDWDQLRRRYEAADDGPWLGFDP